MRLAIPADRPLLAGPAALLVRLITRTVEADAHYRESRKFLDMPEDRLCDMGLAKPTTPMRIAVARGDWG